jgi:hypothetical protein
MRAGDWTRLLRASWPDPNQTATDWMSSGPNPATYNYVHDTCQGRGEGKGA